MSRFVRSGAIVGVMALLLGACNWTMFRFGPEHTGFNPNETKIGVGNVSSLSEAWTDRTGGQIESSPSISGGVVYVGSDDGKFYAYNAAGDTSCSGIPNTCAPLWTATTGGAVFSSPAVANGSVYVGSYDDKLYAFDAPGKTNCSGTPKTCRPLWTGATGGDINYSSPAVKNGVVYIGSDSGHKLYAFDAAGKTNCSGTPKTCRPLWTGATNSAIFASPAIANGVAYVASSDHKLYAFDAAGSTNCSGTPKACLPLWTATTGDEMLSSPAIANGIVYVGSNDGKLYAFDAAGATNCSGAPKSCAPLWTASTNGRIDSSPAVANGVVFVSSEDNSFSAFDAAGATNCSGSPTTCSPLWKGVLDGGPGADISSPGVANGVVYVGTGNHVDAFDAAGIANCQPQVPAVCFPLLSITTAPAVGTVQSSPAVANGRLYFGSNDGRLYAYALP